MWFDLLLELECSSTHGVATSPAGHVDDSPRTSTRRRVACGSSSNSRGFPSPSWMSDQRSYPRLVGTTIPPSVSYASDWRAFLFGIAVPRTACSEDQLNLALRFADQHSALVLSNDQIHGLACFKLEVTRHLQRQTRETVRDVQMNSPTFRPTVHIDAYFVSRGPPKSKVGQRPEPRKVSNCTHEAPLEIELVTQGIGVYQDDVTCTIAAEFFG